MSFQLLGDVVFVVLAVRVLGRDAVALLRRATAAGVRAGVSELRRGDHEDGQARHGTSRNFQPASRR
ncbi:hypothetical protein [Streptomyces sp. IB201691-2A2]|uniref:hypothetical protein n=1 Tax=Streptomyces sp. IB201691-2A2 TaxID=2561920 RepID=UPI00117E4829|nr:hypothetical protein [Streptomyces sp. IB201691-2A2]TRO56125.1 hypothetical protein E4K73_47905 [Streptomyces sp. IB201691-2A2]